MATKLPKGIGARYALALLAFMALAAISPHALAQLAPNGDHYAGRSSDTGFGGNAVDATGSFPTSVVLDLPSSRGSVPLPLQVVYAAHQVGAAGLGWDVPLSYVQQDSTFAHRRPASAANAPPVPRQRTTLSLLGRSADLIQQGNQWVARLGTLELIVRQSGSAWLAYDGLGRTYTFERSKDLPNSGLWLLKSISAAGNSNVELTYQISSVPVDGGTGWEVDLTHISYNTHPVYSPLPRSCAKNDIALSWSNTAGSKAPISLSLIDDTVLARLNTLAQIDITSRESCLSAPKRLRRYTFHYLPDPDTGLPQLDNVSLFGRQGTPEETSALPVASWQYGSATSNGVGNGIAKKELRYGAPQTIKMPDSILKGELAATVLDSSVDVPESGDGYGMSQTLADFTGHGRADLVFRKSNRLWIAKGAPAGGGSTTFGAGGVEALVPLSDDTFKGDSISTQSLTSRRFAYGAANRNSTDIWRQAIDVNGDGRLDIVDAAEEADHWVVYLNTAGGPSGVKWERRSFSVKTLRNMLTEGGHTINGNHVPLSRQSTGTGLETWQCWRWDGKNWNQWREGFSNHRCQGTANTILQRAAEVTYVEWELADLNGDGYPDFVFDSTPVDFQILPPPVTPKPVVGASRDGRVWDFFAPAANNRMQVAFNVLGVRFDTDRDSFARPVTISNQTVSKWTCANQNSTGGCADTTHQIQVAGLADVNGDGLLDLVVGQRAYLGSFSGSTSGFLPAYITLPGPLATQINNHDAQCQIGKAQKPTTTQTQGLRDLTGDGIPDYYDASSSSFPASAGPPQIWIGTGTGFQPPVLIVAGGVTFQFSHETETCDGKSSRTDGGLYDINGDGKPEIVGLNGNTFLVSEQTGGSSPGTPESGRLTGLSNGSGAQTTISYVSAKQFTNDPLPFPEIVVNSVSTAGTHNLGGTLDGVHYAFGRGKMVFNSALDRFVFPGFSRRVAIQLYKAPKKPVFSGTESHFVGPTPAPPEQLLGIPTISDSFDLAPFSSRLTKQQRWLREQVVGQVSDVLTLRASTTTDPWSLFGVTSNDSRVTGATKYTWDAKLYETPLTSPANPIDCFDIVAPFDYQQTLASLTSQAVDVCRAHGFVFPSTTTTWHGDAAPPSDRNIQTGTQTISVDDFGRSLLTHYQNDIFRGDDDVCAEHTYATPVTQYPRVLSALSSQRVYACGETNTFASESWTFDHLPVNSVSDGHITSHNVDRRATDTGALLKTVHDYDTTYDAYGNIATVRTQRDNAVRTVTFGYDPFSLVPTRVNRDATGVAPNGITVEYDPISMLPLASTDPNNNRRGLDYDGFGRPVRSTSTPAGGSVGVLSTTNYLGFSGNDPEGQRISVTKFSDPVDPISVPTTPGRTSLRHFDELGRAFRTDVSLGGDYANQSLIVGWKTFDGAGRLSFAADPFRVTESAINAYGRSFFYKDSGDLDCIVSGRGHANFVVTATNLALEQFPTCFQRSFAGHVETLDLRDASSLDATSPQAGVVKRISKSAIGLTLNQSTLRGFFRLEDETFTYDRLGEWASVTRFLDPYHNAGPVQWSVRRDSLGHTLELTEPERATRTYSYSDWGEPVETDWMDGSTRHSMTSTYDSLSRVLSTDERSNGVVDPYTVNRYVYDTPVSLSPLVNPTFVTGNLASATSAKGTVAFSYDAFARLNARTYTDEQGGIYIDRTDRHADGTVRSLTFNLPDAGYAPEAAQYTYDSAGRLRAVTYSDRTGSRSLYSVSGMDVFGRVTAAQLGATAYQASYTPGGRRLIRETSIRSASGSRRTIFGQFDPRGRELSRQEISDDSASGRTTTLSYDSLGRLASATLINDPASAFNWVYEYDALGNIGSLSDKQRNTSTTLTYDSLDKDRLCHISYANNEFAVWLNGIVKNLPAPYVPCNVKYDGSGSIVTEPARWGTRRFSYFASGNVRTIAQGNQKASFAYDPFGQLQVMDLEGALGAARHERRYGELIERHYTSSNGGGAYGKDASPGGRTSFITRNIPGPAGMLASRRGFANDWIYAFGEVRGNRVSANQDGTFVQKVDYQPYGEAKSIGAALTTTDYTGYQWNGGDELAEFGLAHLGARVYDPEIGRFLSRDPLLAPQTAATSNPYAFAVNDPWNGADPSGLCIGAECDYLNSLSPFGVGFLIAGIDALAGSGGGHASGAPQTAPPLSAGPQTQGGIQLRSDVVNSLGYAPPNVNFDKLAEYHFTRDETIERINNSPSLERDAAIDAYNAGIDRAEHYVRVGGFAVAGGALIVAGGAAALPWIASASTPTFAGTTAALGTTAATFEPEIEQGIARGSTAVGQYGGQFSSAVNEVGGEVWTSTGVIDQSNFSGIVNNALYRGDEVNILTGVHGFVGGSLYPGADLYLDDLNAFGGISGVNVIDLAPLLRSGQVENILGLLNGPGTTIAGFCWSGVCLTP